LAYDLLKTTLNNKKQKNTNKTKKTNEKA